MLIHRQTRSVQLLVAAILTLGTLAGAACPGDVYESGVSKAEEQEIVDRHNALRRLLAQDKVPGQPRASNLLAMGWDAKLASAAQDIADTCVFNHVSVADERFAVGQNLYTWYSTARVPAANWTQGLQAWWDEQLTYTFGTTRYDHYTQMAWADTRLVGCGYRHFRNKDGWYQKLYVCNYGPAGNWLGQTPYTVGEGCPDLC